MTVDTKRLRELLATGPVLPLTADLDMFDTKEGIVACVCSADIAMLATIGTDLVIDEPADGSWTAEDSARRDAQWATARAGPEIRHAQLLAAAVNAAPELLDQIDLVRRLRNALAQAIRFAETGSGQLPAESRSLAESKKLLEDGAPPWQEMTDEQRLAYYQEQRELFPCCEHCGSLNERCQCWNDS